MKTERMIRESLEFFHLAHDGTVIKALSLYMEELMRWNKKVNLTGMQDMESAIHELLCDALFLRRQIKSDRSVLDLGSGAGVLAIPLAITGNETNVFSIDKSLRKIQFQRHIKRILHLDRFTPLHGRAEKISPIGVDCLVAKAFGSIPEILEKGGFHIKPGGSAFILKGKAEEPSVIEGFVLDETILYELPVILKAYKLFTYKKVSS